MMDTRSEGHGNELRDELEALRKRLEDLEAIHTGRKDTVNSSYRRGFSRGLASGLVPMAVLIVLTASLLYGQSAVDALFIDQQGKVGIGTTTPAAQLDVKGAGGTTIDLQVTGRIKSDSTTGGLWLSNALDGFVGNNGNNIGFWTSPVGWKFQIQKSTGRVGIGTDAPARPFHVEGSEIHSGGAGGGFSFGNRNSPFVETPRSGERWVWYSQDGTARLWSGSDKLSVTTNGSVRINSLQIGNTTIGEGELQILKKLAAGQLVVDLFNTTQQEYLYAADCCAYDKDRRSVFTWKQKGRINQGYWQLQYAR